MMNILKGSHDNEHEENSEMRQIQENSTIKKEKKIKEIEEI